MNIKSLVVSGLAAFGVLLSAQGCGDDAASSKEKICEPDANVFCRCADRTPGTKLCANDGLSFATPCTTDASRTECVGGEIEDPDTGNPVDPPDPGDEDGGGPTNSIESCPGKSTSLTPGVETVIESDTTGAVDDAKGRAGACAAGAGGGDHVYRIIPTGSGELAVKVQGEGAFNPTIYLRTTCADEETQVSCGETTGAGGLEQITRNVLTGKEYFLFVDGASSSAGKYKLTAKLTTKAFCGDGKVNDGEACDDENNTDNDGCDPSCKKVNGNPASGGACPGHPVHVWDQPVTGTGSNAPYGNTFAGTSTSCSLTGTNNISDHVYEVTPHLTGTLLVTLTNVEAGKSLSMVARRTCTDDATTTAGMCKGAGSNLTMSVTNGKPVYVAVDGASLNNATNTGTYQINFQIFTQ